MSILRPLLRSDQSNDGNGNGSFASRRYLTGEKDSIASNLPRGISVGETVSVSQYTEDAPIYPATWELLSTNASIPPLATEGVVSNASMGRLYVQNPRGSGSGYYEFALAASQYSVEAFGIEPDDGIAALRSVYGREDAALDIPFRSSQGDDGQGEYQWVEGEAPGTYVDNGDTIIVPTGWDGSAAWVMNLSPRVVSAHNSDENAHPELSAFITSEADRAETAADVAIASGKVYEDTAAGLDATTEGDYFSVPSEESSEYLILYRHEAGSVATEVKRYPSAGAVTAVEDELNASLRTMLVEESKVPLVRTSNGKIPLWLEGGKLGAVGVTDPLSQSIEEQMADRGAVMSEAPVGYPPFMFKTSNGKVVFVVDHDGEAYYFGNVVGGGDSGGGSQTIPGASLFRYKSKLGKLINGASAIAKVALTGDSWRERNIIPQAIADRLYAAYGQGADGWIGLNYNTGNPSGSLKSLNDVLLVHDGWTIQDISASVSGLYAPDGHRLDCSDAEGTLTCTGINAETIKIYYLDTSGSFRYQVDGGEFVTVTGTDTGDAAHVEITGLSTSSLHELVIDTTVNSGQVSLFGIYATGISGVEVIKIANGGSRAISYDAIDEQPTVAYILDDIRADVVEICLGSNDYRLGDAPSGYHDGLTNLAAVYRDAVADCGVIITSPAANGRAEAGYPMKDYRDQAVLVASQNGYEHFDQFSLFGTYVQMNALGAWADDLHLNDLGATLSAEEINRLFLQPFQKVA